jgi:DNA-binding transcriptional regulator YbjK
MTITPPTSLPKNKPTRKLATKARAAPKEKLASKGEVARSLILNAALAVIAERGLIGTTHRAIAEQAQIQLSLTTYHFRSLQELIESAYALYVERSRDRLEEFMALAQARAMPVMEGARSDSQTRASVIEQVASMLTEYVCYGIQERREEIAVECAFVFAWNPPESLAVLVAKREQEVLDQVGQLLERAGSGDPVCDAQVLLAMVRQLEFRHVTHGVDADAALISRVLHRLLDQVLMREPPGQ